MLNLIIAGTVGQDAVLRQVKTANAVTPVANFSIATKSKRKGADGKPLTVWVECSLWGKRADSLAQYLTKGKIVSISGEAGLDSYNGKNGLVLKQTCTVETIELLGGGANASPDNNQANQNRQAQAAPNQPNQSQGGYNNPAADYGQDDDVPF